VLGLVIPYFENEEFLREMVASVRCQDSGEWRALVVDDSINGLSQDTHKWISEDERFLVKRNVVNLGPSKSWNLGISEIVRFHPRLEAVAVVHADDRLRREYVRDSLATHREFPEALAIHTGVQTINQWGRRTIYVRDLVKWVIQPRCFSAHIVSIGDKGLAQILRGNFVFCPTLTVKAVAIEQPLFSEELQQTMDLDLISRLLSTGQPIVGLKKPLYSYRRHNRSLTLRNEDSGWRFLEEASTYADIARATRKSGFIESSRVAAKMRIIILHITYSLLRAVVTIHLHESLRILGVLREVLRIRRSIAVV